jgi:hypothetical membrane protein
MAGCVQFVVLTAVAMLVYPGGTVADPASHGYAFFRNFFSDLGRTKTTLGAPNTASFLLFFVALTLAGLGLILFFTAMPGFFRQAVQPTSLQVRLARVLSWAGSAFGVVSGLSFVGVACTPANLYLGPHGLFVEAAFLSFFVASLLYTAAILLTPTYPRRYALVFTAFTLLLAAYLWLLFFGPRPTAPQGLVIQATGQKVIVYAAILTALIQADGARRL